MLASRTCDSGGVVLEKTVVYGLTTLTLILSQTFGLM